MIRSADDGEWHFYDHLNPSFFRPLKGGEGYILA